MASSCVCREELARQTELTEKYFTKMKDLKIMLESSRSRVKVSCGLHVMSSHGEKNGLWGFQACLT